MFFFRLFILGCLHTLFLLFALFINKLYVLSVKFRARKVFMRFDINFAPINWFICYLRIGGVYDKQRPLMFLLVVLC